MLAGFLFFFPRDGADSAELLTGFVFVALYVMAPIRSIIASIPLFISGQVSLGKLDELGILLTSEAVEDSHALPDCGEGIELELSNVRFNYESSGTDDRYPFSLGPVNLTVSSGEVLFIVGGNGSGKSTLVKLLAGLYSPVDGDIKLGGESVTDANRVWFRQHVSVVFSDFYLFDGLLGASGADVDDRSNNILKELELDHKVAVNDRMFSTIELSQGQRKRLAMLISLIEDRPINIFDEWAADQDPHYKEIFYSKLLPKLKAQGKTVIVITHDDRYFDYGDRVIKLQDGEIAPQN
jgi:putative ATP-binding cassette transporter